MIKPFGAILLIYFLYKILFSKEITVNNVFKYLLGLLIFFELFINVGYMFKIANYEVLYSEFILLLLFIISLIIIKNNFKKIRIKGTVILITISVIATEINLLINPITENIFRNKGYLIPVFSYYSILILLRFLMMLVISVAAINIIKYEDVINIIDGLARKAKYIFVICILEWIVKNLFFSQMYSFIVDYIFGEGIYQVGVLLKRGSIYSLQGLLREPAYLTFGVFIFLIIIILSNYKSKVKYTYLIVGSSLILVSGSLSGVVYILALFMMVVSMNKNKSKLLGLGIVVLIGGILFLQTELASYYIGRIVNSWRIVNSSSGAVFSSEQIRLFSITETFKTVFLKRPILGAGLGIPYAFGTDIMIFSSIGIFGSVLWFWYYFISLGKMIANKKTFIILSMFFALLFIGTINVIYSAYIVLIVLEINMLNKPAKNNMNKNIT
ncbi:MAG: hypothetical protein PHQ32_05240 [Firmicutes bacterium]|nr:hypothetical protein [Bacillota bacterium]